MLHPRPQPGEPGDDGAGDVVGGPAGRALAGEERLDLGHRSVARCVAGSSSTIAGRRPRRRSARSCRRRRRRRPARSGPSTRVMSRRSRSAIDAATSSTSPPISPTRRSARMRGDAVTNSFSVASGNTTRADVAALDHAAASLIGPLSLTGPQLLADRRVGGDRADRLGDLAAADRRSWRRRRRRPRRPRTPTGPVARASSATAGVVGDRDAPAQGGEGDGPVHRPGVEVLQAEPLRRRPGRPCSCRRRPGRRWR